MQILILRDYATMLHLLATLCFLANSAPLYYNSPYNLKYSFHAFVFPDASLVKCLDSSTPGVYQLGVFNSFNRYTKLELQNMPSAPALVALAIGPAFKFLSKPTPAKQPTAAV